MHRDGDQGGFGMTEVVLSERLERVSLALRDLVGIEAEQLTLTQAAQSSAKLIEVAENLERASATLLTLASGMRESAARLESEAGTLLERTPTEGPIQ